MSPAQPRPVPEVSLALSNTTYCTKTIHNSLLADISIHTEEADRGSAGQSEPLTFHWHNVLSIHRSILSGEVREVRWRLGINAEEVDRGKKREQWGGSIEWIVRAWNIERIQNESKERKKEKEKKRAERNAVERNMELVKMQERVRDHFSWVSLLDFSTISCPGRCHPSLLCGAFWMSNAFSCSHLNVFCVIPVIKSKNIWRRLWKRTHSPLARCWQRLTPL